MTEHPEAIAAAAEALCPDAAIPGWHHPCPTCIERAEVAVAAARPVIEAEVRAEVAAAIRAEAQRRRDYDRLSQEADGMDAAARIAERGTR